MGLAAPWSALEEAEISVYPWDETGYRPQSRARLGWTPEGLYVLMYSREKEIRAEETRIGGGVYNDSCLELYIGELNNPIYFNFECNPIGAMFIGIGADPAKPRGASGLPRRNACGHGHAPGRLVGGIILCAGGFFEAAGQFDPCRGRRAAWKFLQVWGQNGGPSPRYVERCGVAHAGFSPA